MCDKKRFPSRALAIQRLHEIKTREEKREKAPLRVYYCRICGGYHLTSLKLTGKAKGAYTIEAKNKVLDLAEYWTNKKKWDKLGR